MPFTVYCSSAELVLYSNAIWFSVGVTPHIKDISEANKAPRFKLTKIERESQRSLDVG